MTTRTARPLPDPTEIAMRAIYDALGLCWGENKMGLLTYRQVQQFHAITDRLLKLAEDLEKTSK